MMKKLIYISAVLVGIVALGIIHLNLRGLKATGDTDKIRQEINRVETLLSGKKIESKVDEKGLEKSPALTIQDRGSPRPAERVSGSSSRAIPVSPLSKEDEEERNRSINRFERIETSPDALEKEKPTSQPIVTKDYIIDGDTVILRDPDKTTYKASEEAKKIRMSIDVSTIP